MQFIGLTLLFFIGIFSVAPFTVFVHEMGHAIPALLLTRKKVSVFIGSFGDTEKSFRINLRVIDIWFRYNPFSWKLGLCQTAETNISITARIIFILCGPLASLALGIFAYYWTFAEERNIMVILIVMSVMITSVIAFINSIIPDIKPIHRLHDGKFIYNDGGQIKNLFKLRKFPAEYLEAAGSYEKKEYKHAADLCDAALKKMEHADIYRVAFAANVSAKQYDKALNIFESIQLKYTLNADDYCNFGLFKGYLNLKDECLESFEKSLSLNPNHYYSLNNKGYFLVEWNRYNEALPGLQKAVALQPSIALAYNNLGLAKIKLGNIQEGLADLNKSLQIDVNNPYAYRNLGIYHLDNGDKAEAEKNFASAWQLDKETQRLAELIESVKSLQ